MYLGISDQFVLTDYLAVYTSFPHRTSSGSTKPVNIEWQRLEPGDVVVVLGFHDAYPEYPDLAPVVRMFSRFGFVWCPEKYVVRVLRPR